MAWEWGYDGRARDHGEWAGGGNRTRGTQYHVIFLWNFDIDQWNYKLALLHIHSPTLNLSHPTRLVIGRWISIIIECVMSELSDVCNAIFAVFFAHSVTECVQKFVECIHKCTSMIQSTHSHDLGLGLKKKKLPDWCLHKSGNAFGVIPTIESAAPILPRSCVKA